jgi:hypothetical protein
MIWGKVMLVGTEMVMEMFMEMDLIKVTTWGRAMVTALGKVTV